MSDGGPWVVVYKVHEPGYLPEDRECQWFTERVPMEGHVEYVERKPMLELVGTYDLSDAAAAPAMREALEFYADIENWQAPLCFAGVVSAQHDAGKRARAALKEPDRAQD